MKKTPTKKQIFGQVPKITKKFIKEVNEKVFTNQYMVVENVKGTKIGMCTNCGHKMKIDGWYRHNGEDYCERCHKPVKYKDAWRGHKNLIDYGYIYRYKALKDGAILLCTYTVRRNYADYENIKTEFSPHYVMYLSVNGSAAFKRRNDWYYAEDYFKYITTENDFYQMSNLPKFPNMPQGVCCQFDCRNIKSFGLLEAGKAEKFKYSKLTMFYDLYFDELDIYKYIVFYTKHPTLAEKLVNEGGCDLAIEVAKCSNNDWIDVRAKNLKDAFYCSNKTELKNVLLVAENKRFIPLKLMKDLRIPKTEENSIFCKKNNHTLNRLYYSKISEPFKVLEYCKKNGEYISDYLDYIDYAEQLNIDLTRKSKRFPKNLMSEHDRLYGLIKEKEKQDRLAKTAEKTKKYQKEFLPKMNKRYCFSCRGLLIRPATEPGELIREGETQNICVGGDRYIKRMLSHDTQILFVRQTDAPDKPYVTVEVSPTDDGIIQARAYANGTPPDEVKAFLEIWQKFIKLNSKQKAEFLKIKQSA